MIVCLCHRISDRDIDLAVRGGTRSFDLLQDDTGVASSCGACHDCARETFDAACDRHDGAPACASGLRHTHAALARP